jgi:membrane protein DedA with SNARE-associated domain
MYNRWTMVESFLTHAGYLALILFAFFEACSIPFISAEITFGFAGVLAYQGHLNLALVIIIGALAELAGSFTSYAIGRRGGRPMVERFGRRLTITGSDLDRAERFFDGRGSWTVFVARLIPVVRSIVGLVAGFLEVPVLAFGLFNLAATALWAAVFSVLGYEVGSDWTRLSHKITAAGYVLVILVVIAVVFVFWHRIRHVRKEQALAGPAGPASPAPAGEGPAEAPGAAGTAGSNPVTAGRPHGHRKQKDRA